MCGPLALAAIPAATSAAGSIMGFMGQNAAASANQRDANLGYAQTSNELQEKSAQIDAQQSENTVNAAIARAAAEGRVSADASSFGGNASTTARATNAADFGVGQSLSREDVNSENERVQIGNEYTSAAYARQSQINRVQPGNPLSLGISLAGDAASMAGSFGKLGGLFGSTTKAAASPFASLNMNPGDQTNIASLLGGLS